MTEMPPYHAAKDEDKNSDQDDSDSSSDVDDWDSPLCFDQPRHLEPIKGAERVEHKWRVKEKYKTHCVALVLCLNVGVDPPDVVKTQPCARLQCWLDPQSMSQSKALESIGHALQSQYERWQPRARYKQSLDPTSEEVKKLCCSLRRNAKDERVLFHYNGHGVPKPTAQGEIWVFNRSYTQYIPLSMYDLQTWMGAPSLYVYDCSNAGVIVDNFRQFAEQHEREHEAALGAKAGASAGEGGAGAGAGTGAAPPLSYRNCIQLAACAAGQALPMSPELPADLFTACLTTPVKMAMKWFVLRNATRIAPPHVHELIDKIPGQVTDRRTMLGELNWIFTAITDTIAWSSLPAELFQQLFRADLLTASLCRNFLLADRIMRSYNCTPVAAPALPSLAAHPLWAAWEHTLDAALAQLPALTAERAEYAHSAFFRDQLTAFAVWLELGAAGRVRAPPAQLPMVLQVLLSTLHRVRALQLLCGYLALGGAAVRAVLHVGIFPYMLKLLQASAPNLRASMVYIWSRIVHQDPSCQADLVNAKGHKYFLSVLQDPTVDSAHRTLAAYVLSCIVDGYPAGQEAALQGSMVPICLEQLQDGCAARAQWACIALGRLWRGCDAARWAGVRDLALEKLFPLLQQHAAPEVRAAAAFALGAFMAAGGDRSEHADALDQQVGVHLAACLARDAAPLVRAEILAALQWLVLIFEQTFIAVYIQERVRRSDKPGSGHVDAGQDALAPGARAAPHAPRHAAALALSSIGFASVHTKLWAALCAAAREPHPQVAQMASDIITYISNQVDSVCREAEVGAARGGASSLPPSPNTAPSPLQEHARTLPPHRRRHAALTASADDARARDSASISSHVPKKPIVHTTYVEWAAEQLARGAPPAPDPEARAAHERAWRRARNARLRRAAAALRTARPPRLDTQAFSARCALPPAALAFHPFEQQAAVGSRDACALWEWGSAARLASPAWRRDWGRLTALAYLNAHAHALLAAASHAGHVAVFSAGAEPRLRAAWRALDVRRAPDYRPPPAQPLYTSGGGAYSSGPPGVLLRWCARRASLAAAGAASSVRLWDARAERLHADIPTGSAAAATALWRGDGLLVAGFADGAVRAWDERAPAAPALTLAPHAAPVLAAARRADLRVLVSACAAGHVRLFDTRALDTPMLELRAPAPLAAADVHPAAPLLACGSTNQSVSVYDLKGTLLNTIKFHEGFMGARIGPVSCLAFHPLRAALGVGCKDSTVCVYVAEARR